MENKLFYTHVYYTGFKYFRNIQNSRNNINRRTTFQSRKAKTISLPQKTIIWGGNYKLQPYAVPPSPDAAFVFTRVRRSRFTDDSRTGFEFLSLEDNAVIANLTVYRRHGVLIISKARGRT